MDLSTLTSEQLIAIGVAIVVVVLIIIGLVAAVRRKRRRARDERLRERYGPEYERTLRATGSQSAAAAEIEERERLHDQYRLRDLDGEQRRVLSAKLAELQYRFVEDPAGAVYELGRVTADALRDRGYPVAQDRELALRLFGLDHATHALAVRDVIEGRSGKEPAELRDRFLRVRNALRDATGVHYSAADASPTQPAPTPASAAPASAGETAPRPDRAEPEPAAESGVGTRRPAERPATQSPDTRTEPSDTRTEPSDTRTEPSETRTDHAGSRTEPGSTTRQSRGS